MQSHTSRSFLRPALVLAVFAAAALSGAGAEAQSVRVRGTVTSLTGDTLVVQSRRGESVSIRLADTWMASGLVAATLADIKPGTYVGTAAMPQPGGRLRALEVLIFPEAMRGAGEGHSAWDLLPESTMTNASVAESVEGVDGRTLTLTYKGEQKTVVVPPDAPIVTIAPAQKSDVKPGAAVLVASQRQPDGGLTAARVTVGLNGVVPPM